MTATELHREFKKYFGEEIETPPLHIMETLVKMKQGGAFDEIQKNLSPFMDDLKDDLENINDTSLEGEHPFYDIDFRK